MGENKLMKTQKYLVKFISVILTIILATSTFAVSIVSALEEGTIEISKTTGKVGETVDITFTLNNNPGLVGMSLSVIFDDSALQLVAVNDGGILGTNAHKPELENPYTLSWSNDTMRTNITANGVIATLSFLIKDTALKGSNYEIKASYDYDNYDIYDVESNPVKINLASGSINVENDITEPTTEEPTTVEPTTEGSKVSLYGDATGDKVINIADATFIQKAAIAINDVVEGTELFTVCDTNVDGRISIKDVTLVKKYIVNNDAGTTYNTGVVGQPIA